MRVIQVLASRKLCGGFPRVRKIAEADQTRMQQVTRSAGDGHVTHGDGVRAPRGVFGLK
jgi:hypothetical protein